MIAKLVKTNNNGEKVIKKQEVLDEEEAFKMLEDYILDADDIDTYVKQVYAQFAAGDDNRGREDEIQRLVRHGRTGERSLKGRYDIEVRVEDEADYDEMYAESRKVVNENSDESIKGLMKMIDEYGEECLQAGYAWGDNNWISYKKHMTQAEDIKGRMEENLHLLLDSNGWSESSKKFGRKFLKEERLRLFGGENFRILDGDEDSVVVSNICPFCHKRQTLTFDVGIEEFKDRFADWRSGTCIQDAFPDEVLSPDEREFIKTGICNDCWL